MTQPTNAAAVAASPFPGFVLVPDCGSASMPVGYNAQAGLSPQLLGSLTPDQMQCLAERILEVLAQNGQSNLPKFSPGSIGTTETATTPKRRAIDEKSPKRPKAKQSPSSPPDSRVLRRESKRRRSAGDDDFVWDHESSPGPETMLSARGELFRFEGCTWHPVGAGLLQGSIRRIRARKTASTEPEGLLFMRSDVERRGSSSSMVFNSPVCEDTPFEKHGCDSEVRFMGTDKEGKKRVHLLKMDSDEEGIAFLAAVADMKVKIRKGKC
mmetsp:Transcript_16706/g.39672  ORF Transcript_16706/g.39672 Transcript_16706/m.39672 type:complete len:268 (-) Transcript_16706:71-874(-)